ncbi:centromere protein Chl4/mis15/CENP-N [Aspergillus caelatus]|uniref:Centromere protein Chl4/mis15/CENP-N n=2 Tax=Aspergillus subgen. Circumdati TaxID=2720871 RepID=A0A5N6ZLU8_9EURO|nr:centromere protein Chl4/mis15/CENP-N [Aspergillus caelatus]KAE8358577.1 centromere protein Chl4/mis15/CENP-N [Aspergillus caelatus]KAE8410188.1 centromere protein Chl4/mis15/CENP-N [Aspergillus pseudocaelatus]
MARLRTVRAPTTASLPSNLRIPSTTPSLVKSFGKLSRQALLDLVFYWLDDRNVQSFAPFLERDEAEGVDDEELGPYPAERTIDDVRNAYQELQVRKGGKREVIDRILEGDWRHGITLRQLAMVDLRYMDDHPSSLRWTALELTRIDADGAQSPETDVSSYIPCVHASTFLNNVQQQISPLVKAHYYLARSNTLPLTFLRILVTNSPYQHPRQPPEMLTDSSRVIYVAFPDSCPFVYTSIASSTSSKASSTNAVATDARSLQRIVRDAVPKALSLPQRRYALKATSLSAKSLQALLALRGPGRSNGANGAFSIFADAVVEGSPLDPRPANTVSPEELMNQNEPEKNKNQPPEDQKENETHQPGRKPRNSEDTHIPKKRKLAIHSRFGTSGSLSSAPLDRLDVRLLDRPDGDGDDEDSDTEHAQASLSLTFAGSDVISGIRKLAELGVVDPERMPSWMTGEEAVSVAVVRGGRRVIKDSG